MAGQVAEGGEGFGGQRRAAGTEKAHCAQVAGRSAAQFFDQAHIHGGDAEEECGPVAGHLVHDLASVKAGAEPDLSAGGQATEHTDDQTVGVKERKAEQQAVIALPGPGRQQARDRRHQVVVA